MTAPIRDRFAIAIEPAIWRGYDVLVEPPTITRPSRHFGTHAEAQDYAEALAKAEGWPIVDRAGAA